MTLVFPFLTIIKLTTEQIDDVLIHEMIHYSIAYTGLKDTSSHGIVFSWYDGQD